MKSLQDTEKPLSRIAGESIAKRAGWLSIMGGFAIASTIFVKNTDLTADDIIEIASQLSGIGSSPQLHCPLDPEDYAASVEKRNDMLGELAQNGVDAEAVYSPD